MRKEWSQDEVKLLKDNYNLVTNDELLKLFPDRTFYSLYKKARAIGLYKSKEIESKNRSKAKRLKLHKNGKRRTSKGYIQRLMPNHERADSSGYVMEHILVFEEATGIKVPIECDIHHLNEIKDDNRIENLCMLTHKAHTILHHLGRKRSEETRKNISKAKKEKNL